MGSYRSPGPYEGGALLGAGTYVQDVTVEPAGGAPSYHFRCVFERRESGLFLEGISAKGARFLRVKDTLQAGSEAAVELSAPELPAGREELLSLYRALRPLFLLRDGPGNTQSLVRERYPDGRPRRIAAGEGEWLLVEEYGWDGRAFRIEIAGLFGRARAVLREYVPTR